MQNTMIPILLTRTKNFKILFILQENMLLTSDGHSYSSKVISVSPEIDKEDPLPSVPQLEKPLKVLPQRVSSMFKVLVRFFVTFICFDTLHLAQIICCSH